MGGYGINVNAGEELVVQKQDNGIVISAGEYFSVLRSVNSPAGMFEKEFLTQNDGWNHTHLFGGKGAFPYWKSTKPVSPLIPVIIYTNGTRNREPVPAPVKLIECPGLYRIQFEGEWYDIKVPY